MDYAGIAQKEKLTELQLRVRQLLAQVDQINKEQNYEIEKKQTGEKTETEKMFSQIMNSIMSKRGDSGQPQNATRKMVLMINKVSCFVV